MAECRSRRSLTLSVPLAAVQEEASQQRDGEKKRGDCNARRPGMSGKTSRRVVLLRRRSQEINGGLRRMAPLQLRTN